LGRGACVAWIWSLNWGVVTPELVVGTCPMAPADLRLITEGTGATAVLSLQHAQERLPEAVRALACLQAVGHRTYVHCTAGISRAPLTVFGYLTLVAGIPEDRARELVATGRPESVPYWDAYAGARADLIADLSESIERRVLELEKFGISSSLSEARNRAEIEIIRAALSA
jgi:hypothetical protein